MTFATGSMGPKVAAVCDFVERTGRRATVGALDDLQAILAGHAGTTVLPGVHTSYQPPRAA
jgi:carbamate kinase